MSSLSATLQSIKTRLRENWRHGAIGAAGAIVLGLLFLMSATLGGGLKNLSYDLPYLLRLPFDSPDPISELVMVYMDDPSHDALKQPYMQPWDRNVHARLIQELSRQQAKAVVFDVLFDTPGTNDHRLIEAAEKYGRVVMGSVFKPQTYAGEIIGWKASAPFEPLRRVVKWGVVEAADSDRALRQHFRGDFKTTTLVWRVAEMTLLPPLPEPFAPRWLHYYGEPGTLPYYSYVDALNANVPAGTFSNKVVFVGALYSVGFTGGKGTDDFRTPFTRWTQKKSPGVEVNATTYLNLARADWLNELSPIKEFGLLILSGSVLGFGMVYFRPTVATAIAISTLVFLTVAACVLVWYCKIWFPWLVIGCLQIPAALAWSVLTNTSRLYRDKEALEQKLATVAHHSVLLPADGRPITTTRTAVVPEGSPLRMVGPPIPNHEMLRCIGKGAYGEVWLARDEIGTYHAVKIISRGRFHDNSPFDREFRGLQQYTPISRLHRGLVHILHVGRNDKAGYFFYIMELGDCELNGTRVLPETYQAKNLARELDKGVLPVKNCLELGIDLADALHFLHSRELIHRDIKPSNVIFVDGAPKFADVGLVTKFAEKGHDVTYLGTEGFIAPEGPGTPAADVFSLGKVIYEASMGRAAARYPELPTSLTQRDQPKALLQLNQVILRACDPDLRQRYKSAAELRVDLVRLHNELFQDGAQARWS